MSVWKKTAKANQKTHRERHQPSDRKHLGLLEKKKDYKQRANDYNEKQATLKLLKTRALNKNPDEFYHHMVNARVLDGKHYDKDAEEPEDSGEQLKLLRTQDIKYVTLKRNQELKRIERLQAQLHLTSLTSSKSRPNKHIFYPKNIAADDDEQQRSLSFDNRLKLLSEQPLPNLDERSVAEATRTKLNKYKELHKRVVRERELAVVQQKIQMRTYLSKASLLPPKRIRKGTKDSAPVYKWQYERKK